VRWRSSWPREYDMLSREGANAGEYLLAYGGMYELGSVQREKKEVIQIMILSTHGGRETRTMGNGHQIC